MQKLRSSEFCAWGVGGCEIEDLQKQKSETIEKWIEIVFMHLGFEVRRICFAHLRYFGIIIL